MFWKHHILTLTMYVVLPILLFVGMCVAIGFQRPVDGTVGGEVPASSSPAPPATNEGNEPAYPIAVLAAARHPDAGSFRRFLISAPGKAIFRRYGFVPR